jgi:hypothetical protein
MRALSPVVTLLCCTIATGALAQAEGGSAPVDQPEQPTEAPPPETPPDEPGEGPVEETPADKPAEAQNDQAVVEKVKSASGGGPRTVAMVNTAGSSPRGLTKEGDDDDEAPRSSGRRRGDLSAYTGPKSSGDWDWDISGYFRAPMRIGMGEREAPLDGQSSTTFHAPVIPDDQYLSWQHTNHNPRDWAEIFFNFGNDVATGTVGIQAFNFTDAGFKENGAQFGIGQAFVTLKPPLWSDMVHFRWRMGAFANRYGMAGMYDAGEYDTYVFGRTHAMGETRTLEVNYEKWLFTLEHGVGATRPNPKAANTARFTLLHHAHVGVGWDKRIELGGHYLAAIAQEEDRIGEVNNVGAPDGKMTVVGPEVRFDGRQFGYYYGGFSYIHAKDALTVGPAIEVLHAKGGAEFNLGIVHNYLDDRRGDSSFGNGEIYSIVGQIEHSIQRIMSGDEPFWGEGRDLYLKLYGMMNFVNSQDPDVDGNRKIKYGADLKFAALPWLAVAMRYDRVQPNHRIPEQSFSILSPRIEFRSNWVSNEKISLQYSRYFYNERNCPEPGSANCIQAPSAAVLPDGMGATTGNQDDAGNRGAPTSDGAQQIPPDENVFSITATIWW